jgi:ABC-type transport system involved in multi-copper enzyme maturation permease subunit
MALLVRLELLKLTKRPMTWVMVILQLAILGLGVLANVLSLRRADPEGRTYLLQGLVLPDSLAMGAQFIYLFGAIMLAILTAAAIGSEYSWGTLRQLLATGLSRTRFLIAKMLALAIVAAVFVVLPLVMSAALSLWVSRMEQQPLLATSVDVAWLAALVGRTYLVILMPMSLAFLISLVTRSQLVGVGAVFGVLIMEQIAAPMLWSLGLDWSLMLIDFFPFWCARSLLAFNFTSLPVALPNTMAQERALLTLSIYTLICFAAALFIFRRRDVGGPV